MSPYGFDQIGGDTPKCRIEGNKLPGLQGTIRASVENTTPCLGLREIGVLAVVLASWIVLLDVSGSMLGFSL
jgi:hypothetical protein